MNTNEELLCKRWAGSAPSLLIMQAESPSAVNALGASSSSVVVAHRRASSLAGLRGRVPGKVSIAEHPLRVGESQFDEALLLLENGRGLARALMSTCVRAVRPGGWTYASAANRAGARTFEDDAAALGEVESVYAGSGHRIFRVRSPQSPRDPPPDWANPTRPTPMPFHLRGQSYPLFTQPGVFSFDRVDDGTAFLLEHFPSLNIPPGCQLLDACSGNGVLGLVALREYNASRVLLADDDLLAIDCARLAIAATGTTAATALACDLTTNLSTANLPTADLPAGDYDLILCNPPFHQGREEDRGFVPRFAPLAAQSLARRRGRLIIVANRFLPYDRHLAPHFKSVTTLAADNRYRVLVAS